MLRTTHHLQIGPLGRPGHRIGKAQHTGIQLTADDGLDQIGARAELDQFDVQAVLLIQPCLVGDHGLGIIHHPDVTYLELFLRLRERTQEHKSRNQPELRFHFDLDSDSQRI